MDSLVRLVVILKNDVSTTYIWCCVINSLVSLVVMVKKTEWKICAHGALILVLCSIQFYLLLIRNRTQSFYIQNNYFHHIWGPEGVSRLLLDAMENSECGSDSNDRTLRPQ